MAATVRQGVSVWFTLLIEFVLVITAVLLALWAGEWVKANERKAAANAALERIYHELSGNKRFLEMLYAQHQDFADNFDARFDAMEALDPLKATPEELSQASIIPFRGWDTSWKLAQAKGVLSDIDYDYAVAVTAAYNMHDVYADFGKEYLSIAFNLNYFDDEKSDETRDAMRATLATFITFDQALLDQYNKTLEKLREHPDLDIDAS